MVRSTISPRRTESLKKALRKAGAAYYSSLIKNLLSSLTDPLRSRSTSPVEQIICMHDGCVCSSFCPPLPCLLLICEAGHHQEGSGQRELFHFHCDLLGVGGSL